MREALRKQKISVKHISDKELFFFGQAKSKIYINVVDIKNNSE